MHSLTLFILFIWADDKLSPSSGLLIEADSLWGSSSSSSPPSSSSPNSSELDQELSPSSSASSTTTTSDLSETSVQLATIMADSVETRNQFIRQDSKYYDDDVDVEEDGGFESFQVLNGDGYENEDDDNSHSDENEGQFLGISESAASRQRTFAQLSQNIPEQELKQKASSVLDLINAEISDLHMRELELKKKNRAADGYENDSEDLIEEGSSQGDSDDYTDSAVDVESYSRSASNSSGNVTPADNRDKISQERDSPASPHGGTYHPAEVENKKEAGKLGIRQDSREDGKQQHLTSSAATSLMADDGDEEVLSSGTAVISANKQVGVKVRPIVEEEVKFIELR